MDETTRHTIKISTEAMKALRWLSVYEEERQHAIVERLILTELALQERQRATKGNGLCGLRLCSRSCS
jgi:hypothetical protein